MVLGWVRIGSELGLSWVRVGFELYWVRFELSLNWVWVRLGFELGWVGGDFGSALGSGRVRVEFDLDSS